MYSIIVPAHNEETVIARCISAAIAGAEPGELEVIVACNGCSDRTAEIARTFGEPVRVLEIETPSKIAALNAADQVATGFPRFCVDADVVLPLDGIRRMVGALESGEGLAAWPEPKTDLSRASWPVRAFYRAWLAMPYNRAGGCVGTGVYALSREGRARFERFPEVINDDGFVRFRFSSSERITVPGAYSVVEAPRTLADLIRVKTRVRVGQHQLRSMFPDAPATDRKRVWDLLKAFIPRPSLWPCLAVYTFITGLVRLKARRQFLRTGTCQWGKDMSTRVSVAPAEAVGGNGTGRNPSPPQASRAQRVLAVASGGGHWIQLQRIMPAFEEQERVFVTTLPGHRQDVAPARYYQVRDANIRGKVGLLFLGCQILWILLRERPNIVVSTGAAPGYFALRLGKWMGARTIWVDSIANAEELSLSGRKIRRFADLWLTQWPHLARREGPHFIGAVI